MLKNKYKISQVIKVVHERTGGLIHTLHEIESIEYGKDFITYHLDGGIQCDEKDIVASYTKAITRKSRAKKVKIENQEKK
jgi:hypothetical protein